MDREAPLTLDPERAVPDGARRRRNRRLAGIAAAVGLIVVLLAGVPVTLRLTRDDRPARPEATFAPPAPSASPTPRRTLPPQAAALPVPQSCRVEQLPVPDNVDSALVTAADPTGRLVFGRSYPAKGVEQVLLWQGGRATKIDVPGEDPAVEAVTTGGVAVASSTVNGAPAAWLVRGGTVTMLPGGADAVVEDLNEHNVVVGSRSGQPVVWRSLDAEPVWLPVPPEAAGGRATGVDDDGTVVGSVETAKGAVAYAWAPDGSGSALPLPLGEEARRGGYTAYHVRGGWATGANGLIGGAGADSGLRWNLRTGTAEVVTGLQIRPGTANPQGWLIGTDVEGRGVLLAGERRMTLPDLHLHRRGGLTNVPTTISDDGAVIGGQADDASDVIHPVLWRCS